jgi:hypothetical protein
VFQRVAEQEQEEEEVVEEEEQEEEPVSDFLFSRTRRGGGYLEGGQVC